MSDDPWGGMPVGGNTGAPTLADTLTGMPPFDEQQITVGVNQGRRNFSGWPGMHSGIPKSTRTRSVHQLMSMLLRLDGDRLYQLQSRLYNAGLFGDTKPVWGIVTQETVQAYKMLITEAALKPDQSISTVLDALEEAAISGDERFGGDKDGSGQSITLSNPDDITADADELAKKILGRKLTAKQKEFLVAWTHEKERKSQGSVIEAGESGGGSGDIDAFMAAISGRESGGDPNARNAQSGAYGMFQIMPANWPKWAPMAGLPSSAPQTPENQRKVAKAVMSSYYKQFKNWRDVAIAWYAGPGAVSDPRNRPRNVPHEGVSINQYADQVMARFKHHQTTGVPASFNEVVSPGGMGALGEQIKRMDPVGAAGQEFANVATEFEQLLGGA